MKKTALLWILIGCGAASAAAQGPEVDLSIRVTNGSVTRTLAFGLDPRATDGKDTILNEQELPPIPPSGIYDVRFTLGHVGFPLLQGLARDYRQGVRTTVGSRTHRLKFQPAAGTSSFIFAWDLPSGAVGLLRDLFGGVVFSTIMGTTGSDTLTNPALTELEMIITYDGTLPVQIASFTAALVPGGGVRLDWTTLTETNNYGFEVERSSDPAGAFLTLPGSFLPGQGTTVVPHSYTYTDMAPIPGRLFYRLKQMDLDGSVHYAEPVGVEYLAGAGSTGPPPAFALLANYPNPFNPRTQIGFTIPRTERVRLAVYDILGREAALLLDEDLQAGLHTLAWDAAGLAGGTYLLRLESPQGARVRAMILLK
ncbi:MAG: T9SS type A sorting domain-containing protein [Bacteroidota bacterium]